MRRLARVSGVSEAHFARSFKEAFGVPPHRYLLTRRIERVTALLFNNGVFGDTGGHLTATTVIGQRTKTSLEGREAEAHGYPIDVSRKFQ